MNREPVQYKPYKPTLIILYTMVGGKNVELLSQDSTILWILFINIERFPRRASYFEVDAVPKISYQGGSHVTGAKE